MVGSSGHTQPMLIPIIVILLLLAFFGGIFIHPLLFLILLVAIAVFFWDRGPRSGTRL